LADAEPDGVPGAGVGVRGLLEGVLPPGRSRGVASEDGDGFDGCGGVERPPVQVPGAPGVEGCGVQQAAEDGFGLGLPEVPAFDAAFGHAGAGGQAAGADHRGLRGLAAADGGPAQPVGDAGREVLRVEHRHRAEALPGGQGGGEVVRPRGGGDDRRIKDGIDDHVQALA